MMLAMERTKTTMNPYAKALGENWNELPLLLKTHYPDSDVSKEFNGVMESIWLPKLLRPLAPIIKLIGALVPYTGTNIPFTLKTSLAKNGSMHWKRSFVFPKTSYSFVSRTEYFKQDMVIEYVRFGLGICLRIEAKENGISMDQTNYVIKIFKRKLFFPSFLGFGRAYINETLTATGFNIDFIIIHPLLGKTFSYKGTVVV